MNKIIELQKRYTGSCFLHNLKLEKEIIENNEIANIQSEIQEVFTNYVSAEEQIQYIQEQDDVLQNNKKETQQEL